MFHSSSSSSEDKTDFKLPLTEKKQHLLLSTSGCLESDDKQLKFVRGIHERTISLSIYPKQGILLQHLREEFNDNQLSYFYDPINGKELDYNGLWETTTSTILVMHDADNVNSVVREFQKGY